MNAKTLRASLLAVTTAIALCAAIVPLAAHAYDENSTAAINVAAKGVGLQGHAPVAAHGRQGRIQRRPCRRDLSLRQRRQP